ncbi:recombinase zinc beta ribbon domain-containing protein [Anaerotruncus colihominis]|uniref:recombinase zinc beta ribbon domain-containing protein n=1 Tax=Anaerotruncus colihominis TaxID=169435 RepID=UPI001899E3B9|nr:recombinase zinc beta ribbon domain-containing protein [Anaerotruncus colihominis]
MMRVLEADIVRTIFRLYNEEGWGYKKIANYLTEQGISTPRMAERGRKEAAGAEYRRTVKSVWAIVTVQGIKKYDNVYSGFLTCSDCGAPMFAMSRSDQKPAYTCGTYHRCDRAGCTSHYIRVDKLDDLLKLYIRRVMDH